MTDLLALWSSATWRAEVDAWVGGVLRPRGVASTGPAEQTRLRMWSTVLRIPTDAGVLWLKESNPGQGFEGAVTAALSRLLPDAFVAPLAHDPQRHRMLSPDAGDVAAASSGTHNIADAASRLADFALVQRRLMAYGAELQAAGLPRMPLENPSGYVEALTGRLAALSPQHPQHADADAQTVERILDGLPVVTAWAGALRATGIPETLQHNDLNPGNVVRGPDGGLRWLDVGDAFWSHPFGVVQLPAALATGSWPWGPDVHAPEVAGLLDDYFGAWTDYGSLAELRALAEPARRLGLLHRCESWRRLLAQVPHDRLGVRPPDLARHLVEVTAPI